AEYVTAGIQRDLGQVCTAEELVDRETESLPLDVPKCGIDAGHPGDGGGAQLHRPGEHLRPELLGIEGILTDDHRLQRVLDRRDDSVGILEVIRLTNSTD